VRFNEYKCIIIYNGIFGHVFFFFFLYYRLW
jgi:hypothetical protein